MANRSFFVVAEYQNVDFVLFRTLNVSWAVIKVCLWPFLDISWFKLLPLKSKFYSSKLM